MTKSIWLAVIALAAGIFQLTHCQNWKPLLAGPYGSDLLRCKSSWVEYSKNDPGKVEECMSKLAFGLAPRLADPAGVPALGLRSLDPIQLDHLDIADSDLVKGQLKNVKVTGMARYLSPDYARLKYDPKSNIMTLTIQAEELPMEGNYDVTINAAALFNPGANKGGGTRSSGYAKGVARSLTSTIRLHMRQKKSGALTLHKVDSNSQLGQADFSFTSDKQNDPMVGLFRTIMADPEMTNTVLREATPTVNREIAKVVGAVFYNGWRKLQEL